MSGSSDSLAAQAQPGRRPRGRPPRIDREQVITAALQLLDDVGLDALTMRRLASALDVQVGTLYGYFVTKRALLSSMAESMLTGCGEPLPPDLEWADQVVELSRRMRRALLRFRDGARVYAGIHAAGPNTLTFSDMFIGVMCASGMRVDDATRATFTIIRFIIGHALEEQAVAHASDDDMAADLDAVRTAVESGNYPNLSHIAPLISGTDFNIYFEFGVRMLVRGLGDLSSART